MDEFYHKIQEAKKAWESLSDEEKETWIKEHESIRDRWEAEQEAQDVRPEEKENQPSGNSGKK